MGNQAEAITRLLEPLMKFKDLPDAILAAEAY